MNENFYEYDVSNYLPYFITSENGLSFLTDLLNVALNGNKQFIDSFTDIVDLDSASPESQKALVLSELDLTNLVDDIAYRSELYRQSIDGYRSKGTESDIINVVDNFDNIGWMIGNYFYPGYDKQYKSTYITNNIDQVFTHSRSKHSNGDRFQDGDLWTYGVINITTVDYLTEALRNALEKVMPAGVKYILTTYTDILGPDGSELYLGPINARQYIQSYREQSIAINAFNIPRMLPKGGLGNSLIHSTAYSNFQTSYPSNGTPKYFGVYEDSEKVNSSNPDRYKWLPYNLRDVPENGKLGEGVPIPGTSLYIHYAFCDVVSGRLHSGSYVTSDNKMIIDINLIGHYARTYKIRNRSLDISFIPPIFNHRPILDVAYLEKNSQQYSLVLRKMMDYYSHNSLYSVQDEVLSMGLSRGIDGFEIDTEGNYEHIAYASNVYGKEGFTVSPNTLSTIKAVGVYNDNEPDLQSVDFERYKWYPIIGNELKAKNLHIAYADSDKSFSNFSSTKQASNRFIGFISKSVGERPTDPSVYTWRVI